MFRQSSIINICMRYIFLTYRRLISVGQILFQKCLFQVYYAKKASMGEKKNWKVFRVVMAGEMEVKQCWLKKTPFFFKNQVIFIADPPVPISFVNGKSPEIFAFARFAAHNCRQDGTGCKQLSCDLDFCSFRVTLAPRGRANIPPREYHPQSCSEPFVAESDTPTGNDPTHEVTTEQHKFSQLYSQILTWLPLQAVMELWADSQMLAEYFVCSRKSLGRSSSGTLQSKLDYLSLKASHLAWNTNKS